MVVQLADLQQQTRFLVAQKIAMTVNRYTVTSVGPDGSPAETVAFAQQKRLKMREEVTFYTDESREQALFSLKARQVMDIGATYDVTGADGQPLGLFRKDAVRSLLNSTWHLEPAGGVPAQGSERSPIVAVLRRIQDTIPLPYHFDFGRDSTPVLAVDRKWGIRDRYTLDIYDPELDRRLAIALAVALDALQGR